MNNNNNIEFAAVTTWITIADAKIKREELIAQGIDKKQVKFSSYRWADIKDHSKGYICRVLVVKGLRPELEVASVKRSKKVAAIGTFATESNTANSSSESQNMTYFCRRNSIDETMTA